MFKKRPLGQTGLQVSEIGFGAGIVAGLFVRGDPESQDHAFARAVELGVNHFDTAPLYGDGKSELNLGRTLADAPGEVVVATKVEYFDEHFKDFRSRTFQSIEESLERLGRDSVDILYLHNNVRYEGEGPHDGYAAVSPDEVLRPGGIADALDEVRATGLAKHIGFTGTGDAAAVIELIDSGRFEVMQAFYSLLNPSGSIPLPKSSPLHDFRQAIVRASQRGMGVVAIRVMGGGVLAGDAATQGFAGTTSSASVLGFEREEELRQAEALSFLESAGDAGAGVRMAAIRFALDNGDVASSLLGFSSVSQIEAAAEVAQQGPLDSGSMKRLEGLWASGFRMRSPRPGVVSVRRAEPQPAVDDEHLCGDHRRRI